MSTNQPTTDLLERLLDYRATLDDAIACDLEVRSRPGDPAVRRSPWILRTAAAVLLIACVGAIGWLGLRPDEAEPARSDDAIASTSPASTDTVATTTEVASTTATLATPVGPGPDAVGGETPLLRLAVGDQVMLGAAMELVDQGWVVDATESRTSSETLDIIEQLHEQKRLGETIVLHVGTNGTIVPEDLDGTMAALADLTDVQILTVAVNRSYATENNDLIRRLPDRFLNVSVIDWAKLAAECPGDCFYDDGMHLRPDGQRFYAQLINDAIAAD